MKKIVVALKILVISIFCSVVMMFLHKITMFETIEVPGLSWLAIQFGPKTAAFLWGLSAYCIVSFVYVVAEKDWKGSNIKKALLFGGLIGGAWWIEMIELDQTLNNLVMGLVDGFMITVVCIMTAHFVLPKNTKVDNSVYEKEKRKSSIIEILIVAAIFTLNRLFFGVFLGKYYDSTYDYILIPIYSLLMGFLWVKLKSMAGNGSTRNKALKYGVIIWGMPSSIYMYFLAFLFEGMFIGMTIRNAFDVISMTLAVWLAMKYRTFAYRHNFKQ